MQQIVDLQNDPGFQAMNVQLISIAFDSAAEQLSGISQFAIVDVPMLVDSKHEVSEQYDVLKWASRTGEPSHTFILVDAQGKIVWIQDYGSPTLPNPVMYVPPSQLVSQMEANL